MLYSLKFIIIKILQQKNKRAMNNDTLENQRQSTYKNETEDRAADIATHFEKSDILSKYMKTRVVPAKFVCEGGIVPQTDQSIQYFDEKQKEYQGYPVPPRLMPVK